MKTIMVDIETFGTGPDAVIAQIGACYFNPRTGDVGATFFYNVDAQTCLDEGFKVDADTIYWWLSQDKAAQESLLSDPKLPIHRAINRFNTFVKSARSIWSHATFDFVILSNYFRRLGIKPNFRYGSARDIRTLTSLAKVPKLDKEERVGTHHNALDDCLFQVKYVTACLNNINP